MEYAKDATRIIDGIKRPYSLFSKSWWDQAASSRKRQRKFLSRYLFRQAMNPYPTPGRSGSGRKRSRSFSFATTGRGKRLRFKTVSKRKAKKSKVYQRKKRRNSKTIVHNSGFNLPLSLSYKKDKSMKFIQLTKQKFLLKINGPIANFCTKGIKPNKKLNLLFVVKSHMGP